MSTSVSGGMQSAASSAGNLEVVAENRPQRGSLCILVSPGATRRAGL